MVRPRDGVCSHFNASEDSGSRRKCCGVRVLRKRDMCALKMALDKVVYQEESQEIGLTYSRKRTGMFTAALMASAKTWKQPHAGQRESRQMNTASSHSQVIKLYRKESTGMMGQDSGRRSAAGGETQEDVKGRKPHSRMELFVKVLALIWGGESSGA